MNKGALMNPVQSHVFTASDGAKLHYLEAGQGETLLLLPGGGFSADIFQHQMEAFSQDYRVISLDKRGHGKSEKVDFGYRIARFAHDLHDLLTTLALTQVTIVGHSLGAAMVYNYIDLFGHQSIKQFIIVDEPAVLLVNPAWSDSQKQQYGAIYPAAELHGLTNGFLNEDNNELSQNIVNAMTTSYATQTQKDFILSCMDIPGDAASQLYLNNICQDYRDILKKLNLPVLFITGRASLHPWQSHQWMHEQVSGSKLFVFEEQQGGNHFMMVENPNLFNRIVLDFIKNK
ncbi:alpha/beta fold hydrolase [Shewanella surugensis]|uniref:Alpha/beta hydrolase n=1 Tax=Shewanella surugensis TaxID=212020 RepID=A0ABT0LIQ7_9GAMM|nr:alpha/beta hydrolase [Shewanella surugensis]MCL1127591.1 alpha/beta hydrolase [Shewanella surugensis]